jgi:hypothetical protein
MQECNVAKSSKKEFSAFVLFTPENSFLSKYSYKFVFLICHLKYSGKNPRIDIIHYTLREKVVTGLMIL